MSQIETTATVGRLDVGESHDGNLPALMERAREAFEQKTDEGLSGFDEGDASGRSR
jgi:hypothetical protein